MRKKTRVARALNLALTPEQYARVRHDTPYVYTLGAGDDALCFVGARHSTDPTDTLFATINEQFEQHQADVVVLEGVQNVAGVAGTERFVASLSDEEAITRGGESIYTLKQALTRNLPWLCPEPSDAALMRHLVLELYTPDTIVAWYILRLLGQYHRRKEAVPFQAYCSPFLAYLAKATTWPSTVVSYDAAMNTAAHVLGHVPNVYNPERAVEYTDPIPWPHRWEQQSQFNDITRSTLQYRDRHIIRTISNELLQGKRALVVYGAGHAVMQEPAYRYVLQSTT
jgi:hypothetical protein